MFSEEVKAEDGTHSDENTTGAEGNNHKGPLWYREGAWSHQRSQHLGACQGKYLLSLSSTPALNQVLLSVVHSSSSFLYLYYYQLSHHIKWLRFVASSKAVSFWNWGNPIWHTPVIKIKSFNFFRLVRIIKGTLLSIHYHPFAQLNSYK